MARTAEDHDPMTIRYRIRITPVTGAPRWWLKGGKIHTLPEELATVWPANFKPAIFQVLEDGAIVPWGTPGAVDILQVEAVADTAITPEPS